MLGVGKERELTIAPVPDLLQAVNCARVGNAPIPAQLTACNNHVYYTNGKAWNQGSQHVKFSVIILECMGIRDGIIQERLGRDALHIVQ